MDKPKPSEHGCLVEMELLPNSKPESCEVICENAQSIRVAPQLIKSNELIVQSLKVQENTPEISSHKSIGKIPETTASCELIDLPSTSIKVDPDSVQSNEVHPDTVHSKEKTLDSNKSIRILCEYAKISKRLAKLETQIINDMPHESETASEESTKNVKSRNIVTPQFIVLDPVFINSDTKNPTFIQSNSIFNKDTKNKHQQKTEKQSFFECSECSKRFASKASLDRHIRSHTMEKPYSCELCGKTFSQSGNRKVHMRIHTGEKKVKCSICDRWFGDNTNLANHQRTHTGQKPFKCELCGKCFAQNGNLAVHMRIHSGEKRYQCKICGKWFAHSGTLKRHHMFHEGNKTFECSICNKKFLMEQDLKRHMRVHTGDKPYPCSLCERTFALRGNLVKHLRTHERKLNAQKAKGLKLSIGTEIALKQIFKQEEKSGDDQFVIIVETEDEAVVQ